MARYCSHASKALHIILNLSFLLFLLLLLYNSSRSSQQGLAQSNGRDQGCDGLHRYATYEAKCAYLVSRTRECNPEGYINYLQLFYCRFGKYPVFGYVSLFLWLLLLFYLLGNTAAEYFCPNLQGLSRLLNLRPTVAGVTLLSLGNGAPDVFSSVVSFVGTRSSATSLVGLNSILGGAFFVTTVVVGVISICVAPRKVSMDRACFVRDVCFLLFVLLVLLAILFVGKINAWAAMAYASLYLAYVLTVSMTHAYGRGEKQEYTFVEHIDIEDAGLADPLLSSSKESSKWSCCRVLYFLELPLYLPRRLTIPVIAEEKWSKPFAVVSVTLAPSLLVALWNSEEHLVYYAFGGLVGIVLGIIALARTHKESPPTTLLFPWLAGGFMMSVTWTYITAQELVSLLVSAGAILSISPSILGLTVLAWGNSLGDLIANVAVALHGGPGGAQVALSGCYGGPIFNTLVGLGLSLVLSSWAGLPVGVDVPEDPTVFLTVGFLVAGLLWTIVMLPRRGMMPDRVLGVGLISIYLCFLCVRLGQSVGWIQLQ